MVVVVLVTLVCPNAVMDRPIKHRVKRNGLFMGVSQQAARASAYTIPFPNFHTEARRYAPML
jgi:hypothetical protein